MIGSRPSVAKQEGQSNARSLVAELMHKAFDLALAGARARSHFEGGGADRDG